jgi:4-hydroxy-2-oxoheptanedioate aldolase
MAQRNILKEAAKVCQRVRGVHLTFAAPAIIEMLAPELDYVYLDGEHGCFTPHDIAAHCVAAERWGLTTIARVPENASGVITNFLDRGVNGIMVPHVESVAEAKRAVEAVYFAPLGDRSFGSGRPTYLSFKDKFAHMQECNANMALCLMIESRAGLDAVAELAAVEGVDFLTFGPNDLASSLGHPGDPGHPEVKRAMEEATKRINAAGKYTREQFMHYGWINEVLTAGLKQFIGAR